MKNRDNSGKIRLVAFIGGIMTLIILVVGTVVTGYSATKNAGDAAQKVSQFYLTELVSRRGEVVINNLNDRKEDLKSALSIMNDEDLSDLDHFQAFQLRIKTLYTLEKFAFVDEDDTIYTSQGQQTNISEYQFDHTLNDVQVSIFNLETTEKKVVIASPTDKYFDSHHLTVCFMEINMDEMLKGVSVTSDNQKEAVTFCNIYTSSGIALTDTVLGGLSSDKNLFDALKNANYSNGYSYESIYDDFHKGKNGIVSFIYNDIGETLAYSSISGTDWFLTYLIRDEQVGNLISSTSTRIFAASLIVSVLTATVLVIMFIFIIRQLNKNAKMRLENETIAVKQNELEQRLSLQEQLLEQEKEKGQQSKLITALSSDYWSVYYIELDKNNGVCYQEHADLDERLEVGEKFDYLKTFNDYANKYVVEKYREEFIKFIQPENIKNGLKNNYVISFRYVVSRHDRETYEMIRFAGVRHPEDRDDHIVHAVGACFSNIDEETRTSIAQKEMLSDALNSAEQANKAKTVFLSNMSHEIRTPMNAIIGLNNIALNDVTISPKTRDYLTKIGASAEHLLNLINDILDMSRIESGRMVLKNEEFSFSKLLEHVNSMISGQCQDNGLNYDCQINGQIDDFYIGDNMKLRQVLINILGNAVKFTNRGGNINFLVSKKAEFDDKVTIQFVIKDTGIGMSKEFLPHVFDSFAQENSHSLNKYGSSGLGLAITKNIVKLMNGTIEVESEKGKGSAFTVVITLKKAEHNQLAEDDMDIDISNLSILIVDDDEVALEHAKLSLSEIVNNVEVANSGLKAIEKVKLNHARQTPYNLILIDWKMPEMDGVETTKAIRSIVGNESAIIILTAYKWDEVLDDAVKAGVDSFIAKPLFANSVIEEFKNAVIRKGLRTSKESAVNLKGKHILVAEDIEINAEIMQTILEDKGIIVDLAENGKIAVDKFVNSEINHYSAILMDVRMPEMDGLEATRIIRNLSRADANLPIIAMTANAFDEDVQRSLQAGLDAHLTKPIQTKLLFETLKRLVK